MVSTVTRLQRLGSYARTLDHTLNAAGVTDWVCLSSNVSVQITGTATAITAIVERSTRNPVVGANAAPASDAPITGSPVAGMSPIPYAEPGVAWWRVRVTDVNGDVVIALSGTAGEEN